MAIRDVITWIDRSKALTQAYMRDMQDRTRSERPTPLQAETSQTPQEQGGSGVESLPLFSAQETT